MIRWLWATLLVALLAGLLAFRLNLGVAPSSQLFDLLPSLAPSHKGQLLTRGYQQVQAEFNDKLWLVLEGDEQQHLLAQADTLAAALEGQPFVADWQGKSSDLAALYAFYAPYRQQLLADGQRAAIQVDGGKALVQQALAAWFGPVPGASATDPLLLLPDFLAGLAPKGSKARLVDGWPLYERDGRLAVALVVTLSGSAFNQDSQGQIEAFIAEQRDKGMALLASGSVRHAAAGADQAKGEVSLFGGLALAGILVLLVLGFGHWRALTAMGALLLVAGLGALNALWWLWPQAHWLALVMGASVIGICADYGFHALAAGPCRKGIRLPLLVSLLSSVAAYGVLLLSPFPGLAQLGAAAIGGLVLSYLWIRYAMVELVLPQRRWPVSLWRWLCRQRGPVAALLLVAVALMGAFGFGQLRFDDDIRAWQPRDAVLQGEERAIQAWLGQAQGGDFLLVGADSGEQLLAREEALRERLDALMAKGELGHYLALSQAVPSQARQRADHDRQGRLWQQAGPALGQLLGDGLGAFTPGLTLDAWLAAETGDPRKALYLPQDGGLASAVLLVGLTDPGRAALQALPDHAWLASPAAQATQVFNHYRDQAIRLLLGALVVLAALLWLWLGPHRAWRVGAVAFLALVAGLAMPGLLGQPLNLVHVLALVLLLGLSLDYGVFFSTAEEAPEQTLLAVMLSSASSMLAFGLLIMSATPVLSGFGAVVATGLCVAVLASALLGGRK
ncbi:hypothetical protein [Gallaecimonas sp. GXIMD4217]|uniref:hypothetical protein n=1 Tax=Gallaecimonas sp. GXIMD4217 TaxID=3131927 RepID=UPI00311AC639